MCNQSCAAGRAQVVRAAATVRCKARAPCRPKRTRSRWMAKGPGSALAAARSACRAPCSCRFGWRHHGLLAPPPPPPPPPPHALWAGSTQGGLGEHFHIFLKIHSHFAHARSMVARPHFRGLRSPRLGFRDCITAMHSCPPCAPALPWIGARPSLSSIHQTEEHAMRRNAPHASQWRGRGAAR